jgi:hypothetical protein
MVEYKQRCMLCKSAMVIIKSRRQKPICNDCQFRGVSDKEITDPQFKAMFAIDPRLYEQSYFLRDIKAKYLRLGSLTEKQIEVFKKVADEEGAKLDKPAKEA